MAFITVGGQVTSYAEFTDLLQKDQRVLESNELVVPEESGFVDVTDFVEDMLSKSTDRINIKIKASSWWRSYLSYTGTEVNDLALTPDFDPNRIITRKQDFTDMCVYYCLYNYLLPLIADFGNPESNEVQKIQYYDSKFNDVRSLLDSRLDLFFEIGEVIPVPTRENLDMCEQTLNGLLKALTEAKAAAMKPLIY